MIRAALLSPLPQPRGAAAAAAASEATNRIGLTRRIRRYVWVFVATYASICGD